MPFKPATLSKLRGILEPRPTGVDFAFVMNRWAQRVKEARRKRPEVRRPHEIENEKDLLKRLIVVETRSGAPPQKERRGKPRRKRADAERYAAILLAEIFHKFTGREPSRVVRVGITETFERDKSSLFHKFATAAFEAVNLQPSEAAFREAVKEFKNPRAYSRGAVHRALWGGISAHPDEPPNIKWAERSLRPRRKRTFQKA